MSNNGNFKSGVITGLPTVLALIAMCLTQYGHAAKSVATAVLLRGKVIAVDKKTKKKRTIKKNGKVKTGEIIKTSKKSFVKLLFRDNTEVRVGPESQFKIQRAGGKKTTVAQLIKGQARIKVPADLFSKKKKSKRARFILRTRSATMGVRGTDFQAIYNTQNGKTACITFEGDVALAKNDAPISNMQDLQKLVDGPKAVSIRQGNFSSTAPNTKTATIPTKISPAQFESMRTNVNFSSGPTPGEGEKRNYKSPVPPGMSAKAFTGGGGAAIEGQLAASMGLDRAALNAAVLDALPPQAGRPGDPNPQGGADKGPPPEGLFDRDTGQFAPRAGGFIDFHTVTYIAPPPGSVFDSNTGVYIPPAAMGSFSADGGYQPPLNFELDPVKGFVHSPDYIPPTATGDTGDPNQTPGTEPPPGSETHLDPMTGERQLVDTGTGEFLGTSDGDGSQSSEDEKITFIGLNENGDPILLNTETGQELVVTLNEDGEPTLIDTETGEEIDPNTLGPDGPDGPTEDHPEDHPEGEYPDDCFTFCDDLPPDDETTYTCADDPSCVEDANTTEPDPGTTTNVNFSISAP